MILLDPVRDAPDGRRSLIYTLGPSYVKLLKVHGLLISMRQAGQIGVDVYYVSSFRPLF
jgi:hypothetical protein